MKRHTILGCFVWVLSLATWAHSQAVPTASRMGSVQIGGGFTFLQPDYTEKRQQGFSLYGDYDITQHIGIDGEIHYMVVTPDDISENSYLIGPRYKWHHKRYEPYAKVLLGIGRFGYQTGSYTNSIHTDSFFQFAPGFGLDVKVARHINVRAIDVEFQKWTDFEPHTLSPIVFTFGVAYVLR